MQDERTIAQIEAIRRRWILARTLKEEHPEIADMYLDGKFCSEIVTITRIDEKYEVTKQIAIAAVGRAITGHQAGYGIAALEGLITNSDELRALKQQHQYASGREVGYRSLNAGRGVHALSKEERSAAGKKSLNDHKGIHCMSDEDRKKAWVKAPFKEDKFPG